MEICTGIAERVTLVRTTRPAQVSNPAFHVGILAAAASTSGCSSGLLSLEKESGTPRYLQGKGAIRHGKACWTIMRSSSEQRIGGDARHLSMLVMRPDAPAKSARISLRQCRSAAFGATKTTKSSSYRKALCGIAAPGNVIRKPRLSASRMREFDQHLHHDDK